MTKFWTCFPQIFIRLIRVSKMRSMSRYATTRYYHYFRDQPRDQWSNSVLKSAVELQENSTSMLRLVWKRQLQLRLHQKETVFTLAGDYKIKCWSLRKQTNQNQNYMYQYVLLHRTGPMLFIMRWIPLWNICWICGNQQIPNMSYFTWHDWTGTGTEILILQINKIKLRQMDIMP